MKFTLSWLKEHLETSASLAEIVDKLTMIGLEVERVEDRGAEFAPFKIARVVSAEKHPNADRLKVCMVDPGTGALIQVVCGAPNARAGMIGVFAPAGAHIPGTGVDLQKGVIRGVESHGMLLSERELGLSDNHDGIVDLPADAPVGQSYAAYAGLGEPVIDVAVTPNRPDALGVSGIARDLAAAGIGKFLDRPVAPVKGSGACPVKVVLDFGGHALALPGLRAAARARRQERPLARMAAEAAARHRPPPDQRARRHHQSSSPTTAAGRCMSSTRRRFPAAWSCGAASSASRSRRSTARPTRSTPTSASSPTATACSRSPASWAASNPACTEETTDVLIESALWEPLNIAHTGRKLGIQSDARHRFERGVDPAFMVPGLELATRLIVELCGGKPTDILVAGEVPHPKTIIEFPVGELNRLAGIALPAGEITRILDALGFASKPNRSGATLSVTVPPWRPDATGKADIVEEIVRIVGVDKVPLASMERPPGVLAPLLTAIQTRTRRAKRALAARGLVEAVTWSFIAHEAATTFGGGDKALVLANPIAADMSDMRPSLFPGLIAAARRNADRGFADLALFEVGQVYRGDRPEDQVTAATGVRSGTATTNGGGRHWSGAAPAVSVFDAKADAFALLDALGLSPEKVQITADAPAWFHPGRSGTIRQGPKTVIGTFGEFHPKVLEQFDAKGPLAGFEIILEAIPAPKARPTKTKTPLALSDFQPVRRDFAFVVDRGVEAAKLVRAAEGAERKLVVAVSVFDLFEREALGPGKKSIAIEVTLQPTERTMTEQEIDGVAAKIVAEVEKATGGTLRT